MGALTEREIFDCLTENFRRAADCCDKLAVSSKKGPTYRKFLECLELIDGACRQAAYWRSDTRWLPIGLYMEQVHKRAGEWLRGPRNKDGVRVKLAPGHLNPLFVKLAENLRAALHKAEEFRDKATGRIGLILPEAAPAPHRDTRPVAVKLPANMRRTASGIYLPMAQ